jgi:hypothetical protein
MATKVESRDVEEETREKMMEIEIMEDDRKLREGIAADRELRFIAVQEKIRIEEISQKYLSGEPYEKERIIGEIRTYLLQTVQGIIEAGKRLIAIKKIEKHGDWENLIHEKLGLSQPTVWRFMAIARKFENLHGVKDLHASFTNGVGKLYALLSVPDEELAEFDETGLFRGATAEAIDKMSVSSFRKLVAEKEDWRARAKQLELDGVTNYDSVSRMKIKNKKLQEDNAKLQRDLEKAKNPLPADATEALAILDEHCEVAVGIYAILNGADPKGHDEIVRAKILSTCCFLRDLFEVLVMNTGARLDLTEPFSEAEAAEQMNWFETKYPDYRLPRPPSKS